MRDDFEKFKAWAVGNLPVQADQGTMEAKCNEDPNADSLDLVGLVMKLEEEFGVSVDESELENITTVGEAYELVMSKR